MLSLRIYVGIRELASGIITYNWVFLANKNSIADTKVFDQVLFGIRLVLDLEMAASVLLCSLFILVWNHKVIDNMFDCCRLLVKVLLVLLDTLLATKVDEAVSHILLHYLVLSVVCLYLWEGSLRLMAHKT